MKKIINIMLYILIGVLYTIPLIIENLSSGHKMLYRYIIAKSYYFEQSVFTVEFIDMFKICLIVLTLISFIILIYLYNKKRRNILYSILNLVVNIIGLVIIYMDQATLITYYFLLLVVLINIVISYISLTVNLILSNSIKKEA
ncbi:MAG TPA: hypothetical protein VLM81_04915 [Peptostreptococcaceae bacterium]|nr:hypothetical protein [Peptostreptococcaceae bacterium]